MIRRDTAAQHDLILRELNEERAAALSRISRRLEALIAQLHGMREHVVQAQGADRARELAAYRDVRRQALRYRWYLEVQREAIGLRHHQLLDEFYRIPDAS